MANNEAINPEANNRWKNFSHWLLLIKITKIIDKIKKNNKFKTPPDLAGEPKILNKISSENIVAIIKLTKKAPRIKSGA